MLITESIRWFFFNGILAVLPLLIAFFMSFLTKADVKWYQMLKDGELYVFSTTLCATSIGTTIFEKKLNAGQNNLLGMDLNSTIAYHTCVICLLIVTLIISTAAFSTASFLKLNAQPSLPEKRYSVISMCCAVISILLGYLTFILTK